MNTQVDAYKLSHDFMLNYKSTRTVFTGLHLHRLNQLQHATHISSGVVGKTAQKAEQYRSSDILRAFLLSCLCLITARYCFRYFLRTVSYIYDRYNLPHQRKTINDKTCNTIAHRASPKYTSFQHVMSDRQIFHTRLCTSLSQNM